MFQPIAGIDSCSDHTPHSESLTRRSMQTNRSKTILIVEDEQDVIDMLAVRLLKDTTYTISTANDGVAGLEKARTELPWLIILDLMLPTLSGLEVCRMLKSDRVTKGIPIIILSARATEADRLTGLDFGADDNVTKPFSPLQTGFRIKEFDRRRTAEVEDEKLVCAPITLDPIRHQVDVAGKPVRLTTVEFKLLTTLMK